MSAFLKNWPVKVRYLAEGVNLSEAPDLPPSPRYTLYEYIPLYFFTQGRGVGEPVRRLEGR